MASEKCADCGMPTDESVPNPVDPRADPIPCCCETCERRIFRRMVRDAVIGDKYFDPADYCKKEAASNAIQETAKEHKGDGPVSSALISETTATSVASSGRMAVERILSMELNADVVLIPGKTLFGFGGPKLTARIYVEREEGSDEDPAPMQSDVAMRKKLWVNLFGHLKKVKCFSEFYRGGRGSPRRRYFDILTGKREMASPDTYCRQAEVRYQPDSMFYGMSAAVDRMFAAAFLGKLELAPKECGSALRPAGYPVTVIVSDSRGAIEAEYEFMGQSVRSLAEVERVAKETANGPATAAQKAWQDYSCAYETLRLKNGGVHLQCLHLNDGILKWDSLCDGYGISKGDGVSLARLLAVKTKKIVQITGGLYVMTEDVARDTFEKIGAMTRKPGAVKGELGLPCRCGVAPQAPPRERELAPAKEEQLPPPHPPAKEEQLPPPPPAEEQLPPPPPRKEETQQPPLPKRDAPQPPRPVAPSESRKDALAGLQGWKTCEENPVYQVPKSAADRKGAVKFPDDECDDCAGGYRKYCAANGTIYYARLKPEQKGRAPETEYVAKPGEGTPVTFAATAKPTAEPPSNILAAAISKAMDRRRPALVEEGEEDKPWATTGEPNPYC